MPENAEIMFCKIYYVEPSKLYNYNKYLLTAKLINRTENAEKMPKKCRKNAEKMPEILYIKM